jgi:hypothetical protein
MPGVKPAGAMKTPSGTFAFVVLAIIAAVTILSCRALLVFQGQKFSLSIKAYASVRDEDAFKNALKKLKKNGGKCAITFLRKEGEQPNNHYCDELDLGLKTDKVTKSEVANSAAAGESMVHDPMVTYKVSSANPTDIEDVLKALGE